MRPAERGRAGVGRDAVRALALALGAAARELPARAVLLAVPMLYVLADLADVRPVRRATGGLQRLSLEESLETLGHALFLLAGLAAAWVARRRESASAPSR